MTRTETRQALIRAGSEIIARQGFNNTGVSAVLSAAGVPKGSFYYYFSSKEDFGLAVIDDFDAEYDARLDNLLNDTTVAPLQRFRNYFDAGLADMVRHDYGRGCLIGNLSQELAAQNEVFRDRLDTVFSRWTQHFVRCLEQARAANEIGPDQDVEQLAETLLNGWEGAILRAKVARSTAPMTVFADLFFSRMLEGRN